MGKTKTTKSTSNKPTSARLLKNRPAETSSDDTAAQKAPLGVVGRALEQIGEADAEHVEQVQHPDLLASAEDADKPAEVQNGRILATYLGLGLERNKERDKLVHLNFTFPITDEHMKLIPQKVWEAAEFLLESGDKSHECQALPLATLDIYDDPKEKQSRLHVVGAQYTKADVAVVEETGKGEIKEVVRFKFRLLMERTLPIMKFADWHDGEQFWIEIPSTQGDLV